MRKKVTLYTDGYCQPNPGRGGYGVVLMHGEARKELCGGAAHTTNNRMELFAVIVGLEALKVPCAVQLYSDSRYVVERLRVPDLGDWLSRRARRAHETGGSFPNQDLWARLAPLVARHAVTPHWVKGHSGVAENERCDALALEGASAARLPPDPGYRAASSPPVRPAAPAAKGPKVKVTAVGQPCRKCGTPVVKRIPRQAPAGTRRYTYAFYLLCPACRTMYMVEEAKVFPAGSAPREHRAG